MSNKPSSECQRVLEVIVWWEPIAMPVLWQCSNDHPSEEPHRLSSASPACTAQHPPSPSHIQPECGETVGFCSRVAESLFGDGQCDCAAA